MNRGCWSWMVITVITLIPASLAVGQEQEQQKQEPQEKRGWSDVADVEVAALSGNTATITMQFENDMY